MEFVKFLEFVGFMEFVGTSQFVVRSAIVGSAMLRCGLSDSIPSEGELC